jgi:hypothetical protein
MKTTSERLPASEAIVRARSKTFTSSGFPRFTGSPTTSDLKTRQMPSTRSST